MVARKKKAMLPCQGTMAGAQRAPAGAGPSSQRLDVAALLRIGAEAIVIDYEEDDRCTFMAEFIEPLCVPFSG